MSKQESAACAACPAHNVANLKKMGVNMESTDFVLALAGNPNTGKSTVFNALTGLRQHTGNWPGKTVTRAEGGFVYGDHHYKIVDLPGAYSLLSTSTDEEIARNFILFAKPDVTVIVADASRLERNLNLALQVLEITDRAVLCLNLMDEARRNRLEIDVRLLAKQLGIPVVPTAARQNEGIPELLAAIRQVATGEFVCRPHRIESKSNNLKLALDQLVTRLETAFPGLTNSRWVALRLLEGDARIAEAVQTGELAELAEPERPRSISLAGELRVES